MAIGVLKNTTIIGVEEEVTEGTYVAPSAATSYIQPLEDGFSLTPAKELVERTILTSSIGNPTPRVGTRTVEAALPVEFRGSGVEGGAPDFDLLLKGLLGNSRTIAAQVTSKAVAHTASQIEIEDADIGDFTVGDIIAVLEAGDHSVHAVESVDPSGGAANINIVPARSIAPSASVVISKSQTYFPANAGHPSLSLSYYWGNEIVEHAIGTKVTSMSLDSFTTGGVASFNFGLGGLNFDRIDGAAPHTPTFDAGIPPIILNACVFQNDTQLDINEFGLSVENTLGFLTSTCSANGRISSRVTERAITGTFNPYLDDTSVAQFTNFIDNTAYSLFISAYNPSAVTGEIDLGSVVGLYLPNCITTETPVADQEGVLTDAISFQATRGDSGGTDEIFIGMV
jgi:hypothetical protein